MEECGTGKRHDVDLDQKGLRGLIIGRVGTNFNTFPRGTDELPHCVGSVSPSGRGWSVRGSGRDRRVRKALDGAYEHKERKEYDGGPDGSGSVGGTDIEE